MLRYFHADLDAFYASVEQLDHPQYRGKPLIVGGLPSDKRGVVSAASYEARAFGVHSAMPILEAHKLCPQGIFVRGRMGRYQEKSEEIMAIFEGFCPRMEQLSVDEAFLDISGTEKVLGPWEEAARNLKSRVREETGLTVSIGGAGNKYVAKIASGMSKPDGLCLIPPGGEEAFMRSLPVGKIWGAGKKTQEIFAKYGLKTCEDIYGLSQGALSSMFGKALGLFLYRAVRGEGAESFDREGGSHSMSAERTFGDDLYDRFAMETALLEICQTLMFRLLSSGEKSATISLKIRYGDFSTDIFRETFAEPLRTLNGFYSRVLDLFNRRFDPERGERLGVRLIGAGLMNLAAEDPLRQGELFEEKSEKERRLEESILSINAKHPGAALRRGRSGLSP
ncbi:MAG: DNA polymerase IV [Treponema sp.]|nr:DNA polymerase IV [Treponema sp.]